MKRLVLAIIATVMFGFVGNAQEINDDFYKRVLQNSQYAKTAEFQSVSELSKEDVISFEKISEKLKNQTERKSFKFNILLKNQNVNCFVFLLDDGFTTLSLIEGSDLIQSRIIETKIDKNYNFETSYANSTTSKRQSCSKGAAQVQAAGASIAFAGFFGCVACPFVGGAIGLLGTIGAALCP